jgi:hypothetical protein
MNPSCSELVQFVRRNIDSKDFSLSCHVVSIQQSSLCMFVSIYYFQHQNRNAYGIQIMKSANEAVIVDAGQISTNNLYEPSPERPALGQRCSFTSTSIYPGGDDIIDNCHDQRTWRSKINCLLIAVHCRQLNLLSNVSRVTV